MRIAITGVKGQLGRELVRSLAGHELVKLDRAQVDVADPISASTIRATGCEVIIHAAAMTDVDACELDPERAHQVNANGTAHVTDAAQALGARLVYVSTDYVFDGTKHEPYIEADSPNPINTYGRSKLEGERIVERLGGAGLVVRTAWVYGLGTRNFVTEILRLARSKPTLHVVDDQIGSPTWARDLAGAIRDLIATSASGIVHAAGRGACSRFDLARAIVALAALETEILPTTSDQFPRPARRPARAALAQCGLEALGLSTPPWAESLRTYFKLIDEPQSSD
jgi:dTDP-4-dehydrorhamnose reductase